MDFFEEIIKDPSTCDARTFKLKEIKTGVKLRLCKDKVCIQEKGDKNCKPVAQALLRSKDFYNLDDADNPVRKETVDFLRKV